MKHETAGDPMSSLKWTCRTTAKISDELKSLGINVCARTVARLLRKMDFSLRVNHKKLSGRSHPHRDAQFSRIAEMRERCVADKLAMISIDTKKKELVGNFKNAGAKWDREPVEVNDHDFRSQADGIAVPYGVYDMQANRGTLFVGTSSDTPEFAVDCIEKWWRTEGQHRHPHQKRLFILADGGGSNASNSRVFKFGLQHRLCIPYGITVEVAHYPPGASKWNPIEHRLFSELSKNWAGRPLDSYETILKYARTTKTSTGLQVRAHLVKKPYKKGIRISDAQMRELAITRNDDLPKWNYSILPS